MDLGIIYNLLQKVQNLDEFMMYNNILSKVSEENELMNSRECGNIEASNKAQHVLLADNETLLHDFLQTKKELEKNFRDFEKLFKLADDNLKCKEDKAWKALDKPKDIRILLDKLNEYSNSVKNNNFEDEEKSP